MLIKFYRNCGGREVCLTASNFVDKYLDWHYKRNQCLYPVVTHTSDGGRTHLTLVVIRLTLQMVRCTWQVQSIPHSSVL